MIKNIIKLLDKKDNVDEYKIIEVKTASTELFFIKDELNMSRGKDVTYINLTIYRNFEIKDQKFKGSSTTKISPTMSLDEIEGKIDNASLAASFVTNQYFDLVSPTKDVAPEIAVSSVKTPSLSVSTSNRKSEAVIEPNPVKSVSSWIFGGALASIW